MISSLLNSTLTKYNKNTSISEFDNKRKRNGKKNENNLIGLSVRAAAADLIGFFFFVRLKMHRNWLWLLMIMIRKFFAVLTPQASAVQLIRYRPFFPVVVSLKSNKLHQNLKLYTKSLTLIFFLGAVRWFFSPNKTNDKKKSKSWKLFLVGIVANSRKSHLYFTIQYFLSV